MQKQAAEGSAQFDVNRIRNVKVRETKRANRERTFKSANIARFLRSGLSAKSGWRKARPGRQQVEAKSGNVRGNGQV